MQASLKKTILIVIASSAGFLLLLALGWYIYFNSLFTEYQDGHYKFSIKYPKTWKVMIHPYANVAVVFLRPKDTSLDVLQENFNVTIQQVPVETPDLASFNATVKNQMTAVFGKSINIIVDKPVQWDWRLGHEIVIEAPTPDHLKMVNAWVIRGGHQAYIMTFLGDMNKYTQDQLVVDAMIRSLELQ